MSASYKAIFPSLRTVTPPTPPPPEWQGPVSGAAPSSDSFAHDVMEILNPLQHIPIVSVIYRQMTGDKIEPMERIAGDTLYGGVIGLVSSVANVAFEQVTGKDFGETALALLGVGQDKPTAVAANATAEQSQASRVADGAPVQLMPVATTAVLSSTSQTEVTSVSENGILSSLNRNGIGLDVEPPAPLPVTTSSLDDTNTNALLASLNRNGSGLELELGGTRHALGIDGNKNQRHQRCKCHRIDAFPQSGWNRNGFGSARDVRLSQIPCASGRRAKHQRDAALSDVYSRAPKIAVPTRTWVAPKRMAISKSALIPILR